MRALSLAWLLSCSGVALAGRMCTLEGVNCFSELSSAAARSNWSDYRTLLQKFSQNWTAAMAMRTYVYDWWHPGLPHGIGCAALDRLGSDGGEVGKPVCDPDALLSGPCHVISVGSNGDAAFEIDVHRRAPHCEIDTFDGTLIGTRQALRENIPSYVRFHAENWGRESWRHFIGKNISLLKIDCEGCEVQALPPYLENIPTQQIVIEVHGCVFAKKIPAPMAAVDRMHSVMAHLQKAGFRIFAKDNNILFSDGTCIEYSLTLAPPKGHLRRQHAHAG